MTKLVTEQIKDDARKLLERGWCRTFLAEKVDDRPPEERNKSGFQGCDPGDEVAVNFCPLGAILRAASDAGVHVRVRNDLDISNANDTWGIGHEHWSILLDRAEIVLEASP